MKAGPAVCLAVAVVGVAGCDAGEPGPTLTSGGPTSGGGCARHTGGGAAVTLTPGPTAGIPETTAVGEALAVDVAVLDRACRPVSGAALRVWHTDARGLYGPEGGDECCFYEARGRTDHNGLFRLETIRPARYPEADAPPAHMHVDIDGTMVTIVFGSGSTAPTVTPGTGPVALFLEREDAAWRGEVTIVLSRG